MATPLTESPLPSDAIGAGPAARLIHSHISTIHRWVLDGIIPGWRRGRGRKQRRLFVSAADVLAQVEAVPPRDAIPRPVPIMARAERKRRNREILKRHGLDKYVGRGADVCTGQGERREG